MRGLLIQVFGASQGYCLCDTRFGYQAQRSFLGRLHVIDCQELSLWLLASLICARVLQLLMIDDTTEDPMACVSSHYFREYILNGRRISAVRRKNFLRRSCFQAVLLLDFFSRWCKMIVRFRLFRYVGSSRHSLLLLALTYVPCNL